MTPTLKYVRNRFRGLRFRGLSFRGLSFRGLRFRGLRFRGLSFRGLSFRDFCSGETWFSISSSVHFASAYAARSHCSVLVC